jgi:ClpX C4-type zinc finger
VTRGKPRQKRRVPPPALAGWRVEQYAIRDRAMKYSGHGSLFQDGQEVGPVPCLAICRGDDEVLLVHCDRRWNVLGISGYPNIKAAKQRAERIYPGISAAWVKTRFTKRQVTRYLDSIGQNLKCAFCRKAWHQVERMLTKGDSAICDACIRELSALIYADVGRREIT